MTESRTHPTRPYREFGSWLRSRRLARRMTQEELARRLNYAVTYVRKIEWGERRASEGFRIRLAQVLAVPASSLPAADPATAGTRLPEAATPLVGRMEDVAAVTGLLDRGCRLVTLLGPPGIGKSRLALAVATHVDEHLPGGSCFVPLADVSDPERVTEAIWLAIGMAPFPGEPDDIGRLAERLCAQDMLLVLDNFEHVVEASSAVGKLLALAPGLRVVVTSRQALNLGSETHYFVPPLALPERPDDAPDRVAEVPAVALFLARARKVLPDFTLGLENAADVVAICARLQGIPLAIELAAGAARFMPPDALLAHLGVGLDLPVPGPRDGPQHQRTLRAAIGWSFDLLRPPEHLLMTRMAVFVGGCTADAVTAVCIRPNEHLNPRAGLASLASKSLVEAVPGGPAGTRFLALEAIRGFAAERLEASGQVDIFRRQHAAWCVALVEETEPGLTGAGQAEALATLEAEHANVRAGIAWSLEHDVPTAVRLCAGMWRFWWMRGHLGEGRRWLDAALSLPQEGSAAQALALAGGGVLARTQGAYDQALALLEQGAALARLINDRRALALASINLGIVAEHRGDHDRAWSLFEESRGLYLALGDLRGLGHSVNCLGNVRLGRGDLDASTALFEEALSVFREVDDDWSVAMVLGNLGWIAYRQGRLEVARLLYEKTLVMYRALGDDRAVATTLLNLGITAPRPGASDDASGLFEEALLSLSRLGERLGVAECLEALASARATSDPERAAVLLSASSILRQRIGAPLSGDEQAHRAHVIEILRAAIGETRFDLACEQGRSLSEDEVVVLALSKP